MHVPTPEGRPCVREQADASVIRAFGDEQILHLSSADTDGKFTMWTNITPPGGGPPPHYHEREDEWFLPLSGPAEFLVDDTWTTVPARTAVFMPRRSIHTFRNPNDTPLEMLIQTMPGGFEDFFAECEQEFQRDAPPDMDRIVAIAEKYGIYFVAG